MALSKADAAICDRLLMPPPPPRRPPKKKCKVVDPRSPHVFVCTVCNASDGNVDVLRFMTATFVPPKYTALNEQQQHACDSSDEDEERFLGERLVISLLDEQDVVGRHFDIAFDMPLSTNTKVKVSSNMVTWKKFGSTKNTIPKAILCVSEIIGRMFPRLKEVLYESDCMSDSFNFRRFATNAKKEMQKLAPGWKEFQDHYSPQEVASLWSTAQHNALQEELARVLWRCRYFEAMGFEFEEYNYESMIDIFTEEIMDEGLKLDGDGYNLTEHESSEPGDVVPSIEQSTCLWEHIDSMNNQPVKSTDELQFSGDLLTMSESLPREFKFRLVSIVENTEFFSPAK